MEAVIIGAVVVSAAAAAGVAWWLGAGRGMTALAAVGGAGVGYFVIVNKL